MKKLYIAPQLELLCLAPAERIAQETGGAEVEFDEVMGVAGIGPSTNTDEDIELDIW